MLQSVASPNKRIFIVENNVGVTETLTTCLQGKLPRAVISSVTNVGELRDQLSRLSKADSSQGVTIISGDKDDLFTLFPKEGINFLAEILEVVGDVAQSIAITVVPYTTLPAEMPIVEDKPSNVTVAATVEKNANGIGCLLSAI